MSNRAMSWAIEVRGLPIASKAILMLLADCHNGSTGQCNPSIEWLSERAGLKTRMLMTHLAKLEETGLIERETTSHGRGRGKTVLYHLKIGILGAISSDKKEDKDVQENAGAKECTCNKLPLDVHDIACALYEEPEGNRNNKSSISFDDARKRYLECPLKAQVQNRKKAEAAWSKALAKVESPEVLLKAINTEIRLRTNPKGFIAPLPDMFRWLRDERWLDLEAASQPEQPKTLDDWKQAAANYCELQVWPADLGPPPHQPDCRAPVGLIKTIAKRMQGHAWHSSIIQNMGQAA